MFPPAADEIEVSLFGPGYGEGIAVHMGLGNWITVDSCIAPGGRACAPLSYLHDLGIDPGKSVKLIVASHWHDDHVRGLTNLVRECPNADFVCAGALTKREFISMVTRYEHRSNIAVGSGVHEIFSVLELLRTTGRQAQYAVLNRTILDFPAFAAAAGGPCRVITLSPSDRQIEIFWEEIASLVPALRDTRRRAVTRGPNHVAVALWISIGHDHVLLGSDLEETQEAATGWTIIAASTVRPQAKAAVVKVPHHGSVTGHSDAMWREMVAENAYAILTPFTKGNVHLPTIDDAKRISMRTSRAYSTTLVRARSTIRRPPEIERQIRETVGHLRMAEPRFGHIRLRKKISDAEWNIQLSEHARPLANAFG